ncbi:major facilitator superfamily domain-containing protein [Penicillium verhagenii]|nr:major facilitator superfamily domain-containing protein [Penicillium verhagenii]
MPSLRGKKIQIVPVLPFALQQRAGVSLDDVASWNSKILGAFGVTNLIGSLVVGFLPYSSGSRKGPFTSGLVALIGSTTIFWIARTPQLMMIARAVQGFSASVVWVIGLSILGDTCDPDTLGTTMAYANAGGMFGSMLGPTVGGALFSHWGYDSVFIVALALLFLDILLRLAVCLDPKDPQTAVETGCTSTSPLLVEQNNAQASYNTVPDRWAVGDNQVNGATDTGSRVATATHVTGDQGLGFWDLLKSSRLAGAFLAVTATQTLFASCDSGVVRITDGENRTIGKWIDKYGTKLPAIFGQLIAGTALICLRFITDDSASTIALFCMFLFIYAFSQGTQDNAMLVEVSLSVDELAKAASVTENKAITSQAFGLIGVAVGMGQLLGPFVMARIMDSAGFGTATLAMGCLDILMTIPVLLLTGTRVEAKA